MKFSVRTMDDESIEIEAERFAIGEGNGPPALFFFRLDDTRCAAIAPGEWISVQALDAVVPEVEDSDDA